MSSRSKGSRKSMGGWEPGGSVPPAPSRAVVAPGAYPSAGRISAAAKAQGSSYTPIPETPWAQTGRCTVEALVNWAFGPQRVAASPVAGLCQIEAEAAGYAWQATSADGVAAVERIGTVGCRIDISGPGRDMAHPVAELVAHVVALVEDGDVVREWGKLGVRPGGWNRRPRYAPADSRSDGDAVWVYREDDLPKRTGMHCPIVLMNSPLAVASARRMYVRWFDAMGDVYVGLSAYVGLPMQLLPVAALRVPWMQISPEM